MYCAWMPTLLQQIQEQEAVITTTKATGEAAGYVVGDGEAFRDAAGKSMNDGEYKAGQTADATQDAAATAAAQEAGGGSTLSRTRSTALLRQPR
jgi:hypothetical protein